MGLRQPSKTGAFFAQAAAGTQQQEEARKKLKQTQALGGAASAGTGMVAAQTEAQKGVTEQVKEQTGQAASTMVAAPIKSATAEAIATPTTTVSTPSYGPQVVNRPAGTNIQTQISDVQSEIAKRISQGAKDADLVGIRQYLAGLQAQSTTNQSSIDELAQAGNVAAIEKRGQALTTAIGQINSEIEKLDDQLSAANAADAKKINDEKTRLTTLLQSYQDKLTKENLGQMATTSTLEEELLAREKLLAEQGDEVGKLKSLFGKTWEGKKRGGLESQIYSKDLEAIQEAASAGLAAKERATRTGEAALTGYTEQLDRSKKAFTEALDKDSKKLEILKMDPKELSGYTRKELTDLFGADQAKKLFSFSSDKDDATVTGTTSSSTKKALADRLTKATEEQAKIAGAKTTALGVQDAKQTEAEENVFGNSAKSIPGALPNAKNVISRLLEDAKSKHAAMEDISDWQRKEGHSKRSASFSGAMNIGNKAISRLNQLEKEAEEAKKTKNTARLNSIKTEIGNVMKSYNEMKKLIDYGY